MKRLIAITIAVVLTLTLCAMPVLAGKGDNPANDKEGGVGGSNNAFLYLYEKDISWDIVWGGAWGKMKFNLAGSTFDFNFNGHNLTASTGYSLIYYPEPQTTWPHPVTVLSNGTSDAIGDIHLAGSHDFNNDMSGIKIWLVLTSDIVGGSLSGWNPTDYLFEHSTIDFNDTDIP